jgi:EAL domain-containing protein (putative c-di-GMP-specific phosphodiesterase class I)
MRVWTRTDYFDIGKYAEIRMMDVAMQIADLRFLIVEDHELQRRSTRFTLESLGARHILEASEGRAGLAGFHDAIDPIDIIVSDLDMPEMDGMEFIRLLGAEVRPVSIILASALDRALIASVETMTTAYGVTLLGAIKKPITAAALEAAIHRFSVSWSDRHPIKIPDPTFTLKEIANGVRNGEFEPYFQPKFDLSTGAIRGVEALARWRHPELGIVLPNTFIKLLEENCRVDDLTMKMLEMSASCCRAWRLGGLNATVSVNLSLTSLADVTLANRITELVLAQGLDPGQMVLEVTESAAVSELASALENLSRLRMMGFGLAIDDYGTGYSSMQQLSRIAFTELKIDQSFVRNASSQKSSHVMLESSLDLARRLNIDAVAEGVETQSEWDLLRTLGCDMGQGYFAAMPMETGEFFRWMRAPRKLH